MGLLFALTAMLASVPQTPRLQCPGASAPVKIHRTGADAGHVYTASAGACEAACCKDQRCAAWNWDSNLTTSQAPAACKAHGAPFSCCWLRSDPGALKPGLGCYGTPHCDSWSGVVDRPPPSCPSASPPKKLERIGCDLAHFRTGNATACQEACCGNPGCVSWNWDSNLPAGLAPAQCQVGAAHPFACCWLKTCGGDPQPTQCNGAATASRSRGCPAGRRRRHRRRARAHRGQSTWRGSPA